MTTVLDLSEAPAWFAALGEEKLKPAALLGLYSAALRSVQTIQAVIVPGLTPQPVDRGLFRAGWHAFKTFDGAVIENTEPHASFVEFGVRGSSVKIGAAMIRALTEWVERKRLASGKDAISAAWAIAKSMQAKGIFDGGRGFRILETLRERYLTRFVEEEIAREIERILR
jgi:hypothetical protein